MTRKTQAWILLCLPLAAGARADGDADGDGHWPWLRDPAFELGFECPEEIGGAPGEVITVPCHATLTSRGDGSGAQGWSIGFRAHRADIRSITTEGTAVTEFSQGGFELSGLTHGFWNEGAFSCVVLSLEDPSVTLPPDSTQRIARFDLEVTIPDSCRHVVLHYVDGLRTESKGRVKNTVTRDGDTRPVVRKLDLIRLFNEEHPCAPDEEPPPPPPDPGSSIALGSWNLLLPLTNTDGCSAGGPENMLRNWVAPHDLALETPVAGEVWTIDYERSAAASGFEAGNLYAGIGRGREALWVSLEWLEGETEGIFAPPGTCAPPDALDCEVVDLQAIVGRLNVLAAELGIATVASDNVLAAAQTYVRNTTDEPYCAIVCLASDDSAQVIVNDEVIVSSSRCGERAGDCNDVARAVLDPGVNKITVLSWAGEGRWSFELALKDPETGLKLSNENQETIVFLGTDPAGASERSPGLAVTRRIENPDCCPVPNPARVVLQGNGAGGGDAVVVETYGHGGVIGPITDVSDGGEVTIADGAPVIRWTVPVSVLNATGVSYRIDVPPGMTAMPSGEVNGCDRIGGAAEVKGSLPSTGPMGAFDDSHAIGTAATLDAGLGSFSLVTGPGGDTYTIRGAGEDIGDGGDSFHFAYRRIGGDFSVTVRVTDRVFPAAGGRRAPYGLMARRDCSPTSKYSMVHANLEADPGPESDHERGDGVFYQFRESHRSAAPNASTGFTFPDPDGEEGPGLINQPGFFRLMRRGRTLTGYASSDGMAWKLVGTNTWRGLAADAPLLVGFFASKGPSAETGTVSFGDLRIEGAPEIQVFENQFSRPSLSLLTADFDATPDGDLPPFAVANCSGDCEAFSPRVMGGRLRLTEEGVQSTATSVFLGGPVPLVSSGITVDFTVFARHSGLATQPPAGDPNPGHGITLIILPGRDLQRVGLAEGGLGYEGITRGFAAAGPSLAVEVDTWSSTYFNEGTGSPANDGAWHLGINSGGVMHSVTVNSRSLPDVFGPDGVRLRVKYTSDGRVSVFVLGSAGQGGGGGVDPGTMVAEAEVEPLGSGGETTGAVGFTGSTGESTQTSEVDDVVVDVTDCTDSGETAIIASTPLTVRSGTVIELDASGSNAGEDDDAETLDFSWSVTGDAEIEGTTSGPTVLLRLSSPVGDGEAIGRVSVDDRRCSSPSSATAERTFIVTDRESTWATYDGNDDGSLDISDPVFHLNFLFGGGAAPVCNQTMDFNGDLAVDISDAVSALNYLFLSGTPPAMGDGCRFYESCGLSGHCP